MVQQESIEDSFEADYIAVIDTLGDDPHGDRGESRQWVLDAVPVKVLDRIAAAPAASGDATIADFLLLTLQAHSQELTRAAEAGGYLYVSVSRQPGDGPGVVRAFATGINGIDNNNIPFFVRIRPTPPARKHVQTLAKLARFSHIPDAEADDLAAFSIPGDTRLAVAVYDVGQASMSALVDKVEHPVMFFDLGWPLSCFPQSVPATLHHFNPFPAALANPNRLAPIVLSHLDWDHWAYALKSGKAKWNATIGAWTTVPEYRPEALTRPWLLLRPNYRGHKLRPSHIHFVQTLSMTACHDGARALRFWPAGLKRKTLGAVTIFRCAPKAGTPKSAPFLKNNQALGMLVMDKLSGARVLLAGDADFPSIPDFAKTKLTGLVAPHHGGKITPKSIPSATGQGQMVMSVHHGCYPGIPHPDVESEAAKQGWNIAYTSKRKPCFRSDKTVSCGNQLIRLGVTPQCGCNAVPNACLCISNSPL